MCCYHTAIWNWISYMPYSNDFESKKEKKKSRHSMQLAFAVLYSTLSMHAYMSTWLYLSHRKFCTLFQPNTISLCSLFWSHIWKLSTICCAALQRRNLKKFRKALWISKYFLLIWVRNCTKLARIQNNYKMINEFHNLG